MNLTYIPGKLWRVQHFTKIFVFYKVNMIGLWNTGPHQGVQGLLEGGTGSPGTGFVEACHASYFVKEQWKIICSHGVK